MNRIKPRNRSKEQYIKECLIQTYKTKERVPEVLYKKIGFKAPEIFSFTENPHATLEYFNTIIHFICNVEEFVKIRFDLSEIKRITIDVVIYMIAISLNLKSKYRPKFNILAPEDENMRLFILSSGLADYFNAGDIEIIENSNYFNIKMGNKSDGKLAKNICDFTNENLGTSIKYTLFLYDMLIEMMTNTGHHAYDGKDIIETKWLVFAENSETNIKYTFIDTGVGIPTTMSKYMLSLTEQDFEKDGFILDILDKFSKDECSDAVLILTGLKNGGFRTRTDKSYRGKGLPDIYDHFRVKRKTNNLKIISGSCLCEFDDENRDCAMITELREKFLGTMFYWEINKEGGPIDAL